MKFIKLISTILILITLNSCKTVVIQNKELYDQNAIIATENINGFKAVNIFSDNLDNSVWSSPEKTCVQLSSDKTHVYSGNKSLNIKWDKVTGGCKWVGIGFGWNNWLAKDLVDVIETCAIQMKVKSVEGSFTNLPVAFALEDYSGIQTYYGFRNELASGVFNATNWTTVSIPLSKFNFEKPAFDLEKVKQFVIQLEGDGNIYLDDIRIVKL
jgi:Surface glycan-binding protein B xyloglucan binding domain